MSGRLSCACALALAAAAGLHTNNSDPTNAIAIVRNLGVVKDNIKVASQLPKRAAKVTKGLNKDLKVMVSAFGGSWPPF